MERKDAKRKSGYRRRRIGYMYFNASSVDSKLGLKDLFDIVFSAGADVYKETALGVMEWMKRTAIENGRAPLFWVSSDEMSKFIEDNVGKSRKVTVYRVLFEFLVPYGFVDYRPMDGIYSISKEFTDALRRIGESYSKWFKSL